MVAKLAVRAIMTGRITDVLRADNNLNGLLFSTKSSVHVYDFRIYDDKAELPEGPIREALPRILIAVIGTPFDTESANADSINLYNNVAVFTHILVEEKEKVLGETIDAEVRDILVSTSMTNAVIIASVLVPSGTMQPVKETSFRNAWRFTSEYRAQAGVL